MSADLLTTVVAAARKSAVERARAVDPATMERAIADSRRADVGFAESIARDGVRVIAECKRRSPSRGVLRQAYDPAAIARGYAAAGAAGISVLTEPTFFDGALEHLRAVRAVVSIPILRKDFIVTSFQIDEAAAAGADAVLLIVAALDQVSLVALLAHAASVGVDVLVEVHDEEELARALDAGAHVVGVNSRNLRTLEVRTALFDEIASRLPAGVVAVAESGLTTGAHLARLRASRYDAFLIGERFMSDPDPGDALAALLSDARGPA
jgi:indole-3-glycerol phosphate synthase